MKGLTYLSQVMPRIKSSPLKSFVTVACTLNVQLRKVNRTLGHLPSEINFEPSPSSSVLRFSSVDIWSHSIAVGLWSFVSPPESIMMATSFPFTRPLTTMRSPSLGDRVSNLESLSLGMTITALALVESQWLNSSQPHTPLIGTLSFTPRYGVRLQPIKNPLQLLLLAPLLVFLLAPCIALMMTLAPAGTLYGGILIDEFCRSHCLRRLLVFFEPPLLEFVFFFLTLGWPTIPKCSCHPPELTDLGQISFLVDQFD